MAEDTNETSAMEGPKSVTERVSEAQLVIHRNVLWALGSGLVPVPVFDLVAVTGVQLKMLREMSQVYGLKFSEGIVKKAIASLLSGLGGVGIGTLLAPSLIKFIPYIGTTLGVVSVSALSGALTHATGRVFLMHFESGGTVLNFDPYAMRAHFKQEFEQAVARMKQEGSTA